MEAGFSAHQPLLRGAQGAPGFRAAWLGGPLLSALGAGSEVAPGRRGQEAGSGGGWQNTTFLGPTGEELAGFMRTHSLHGYFGAWGI